MTDDPTIVEYYLVDPQGEGYRVEWNGPDPSFILLAPLFEALEQVGAFDADPTPVAPPGDGQAFFYVPDSAAPQVHEAFTSVAWSDFVTAARIRDTTGVSDRHAAEMVDLAIREADRLTELLRAASERGTGLLCLAF